MHILLVTSAYKSEFNPVNALFFRDQAKALQKGGNQVGLICALPISLKTVKSEKKIFFSREAYNDEGVDTIVQPFFSIPKTPNRTKKKRFSIAKQLFLEYVDKFGLPEILHVHTFLAGELAIWVKEKYDIPYVVTEHSTNFARGNFSQSQLQFSKQVYKNSKSNIAVSNEFCSLLKKQTSCKFQYVPNVVDTDFFKPSNKVKSSENFTFLNVAHLDAKKNQAGLIKSFAEQFLGKTKYNLIDCINYFEDIGVGEIILNNVDKDGKISGIDDSPEVLEIIEEKKNIPFLINGGFNSFHQLKNINKLFSGIIISSALHYEKISILDILEFKKFIDENI